MTKKKKTDSHKNTSQSLKAQLRAQDNSVAHVVSQKITQTLENNYMPYAMSVIVSRAIPEIDGFKPSHRKLLFTMYKMGLLSGGRTKSANVVGQTMKLNPHGDAAIYETMVRMTRGNGALLHPYVDSKGNFGRQYSRDMQFAASRYTEVKLDKICAELFSGLDKNAVDFIDNYDSTMKEPCLLPASFPSVLVNSNQGIAVGMASNICSFNLKEVCEATIAYIKNPQIDVLDIMPGPDFPGGGIILHDDQVMRQIYQTGRGPIRIRSRYRKDKKSNMIEIYQIPFTATAEAIIDEISELVRSGKVKEISDVRDETDLDGLRITLEYKRGTDPDELMTKLFRFTRLEDTFSCNFNMLINGKPRVLGVSEIIEQWIIWRRLCQVRELSYTLEKKKDRLHLLEGLSKILLDIDKAISIIRHTELEVEVVPNLMNGFKIDEKQAEYVAEIKLRNINRQYIVNRVADKDKLEDEIHDLEDTLAKPKKIDALIVKTLQDVSKKYAKPRQTDFLHIQEATTYTADQMIEDYNLKMFMTEHGYLKKIPLKSLRSAGELKTKEDDRIIIEYEGKNKSEVVFFSDQCNAYKMKAYELAVTKPSELGAYLPNILPMQDGEVILYMLVTDDYDGQMLFGYQNGKISKIPLSAYMTKQNRKKLIRACSDVSKVVSIAHILEQKDFAAFSDNGKAVVFSSSLIPLKMTRSSQGVQLMVQKKGSKMTGVIVLDRCRLDDPEHYRIRKIPSVGYYLKEETLDYRQLSIGEV